MQLEGIGMGLMGLEYIGWDWKGFYRDERGCMGLEGIGWDWELV